MSDYAAGVVDQVLDKYLAHLQVSAVPAFAIKRICRDMCRFVRGFGIWSIGSGRDAGMAIDVGQDLMHEWRYTRARWLSDPATYGALRVAVEAINRLEPGLPLLQLGWRHTHVKDHWCLCDRCFAQSNAVLDDLGLSQEERDRLVAAASRPVADDIEPEQARKRA